VSAESCEKALRAAGFKSRDELHFAARTVFLMAGVLRPTWRSRLFGDEGVQVLIGPDHLLLRERRDFTGILR
jgi:hypothetical protein